MSFNYFGYGDYLECACAGSLIVVWKNSGEVCSYPTSFPGVLPKQRLYFEAPNVMWILYDDKKEYMYVGRADNSVDCYRVKDNLLCASYSWEAPKPFPVREVGAYYYKRGRRVTLNGLDNRTCYIEGMFNEFIFNEPNFDKFNNAAAIAQCVKKVEGLHLIKMEGEVHLREDGKWIVPNSVEVGNLKRFI